MAERINQCRGLIDGDRLEDDGCVARLLAAVVEQAVALPAARGVAEGWW